MQYLILITSNPAISAHFDLQASGELVDSKAVDGDTQFVVTRGAHGAIATEVPAGDADVVTGYYLVDVADQARAAEIAARFPEAAVDGGGIRLTRVWTQDDFDAATG